LLSQVIAQKRGANLGHPAVWIGQQEAKARTGKDKLGAGGTARASVCAETADMAMKIRLISITKRRGASKESCVEELTAEYVKRAARYSPVEAGELATEDALLKSLERPGRTAPVLVALDSRGKQLSSEELAGFVRQHLERGTQELIFAIGPADGWTAAALGRAQQTLSLGKITLPHELARVVVAEQIYRAFTILNNHPYHGGH